MAESGADILIHGETGTGKDLVARCLHDCSSRRNEKFVSINCGAIPETLIESELFGHEAGAFTGAEQRRMGKFEYASGGTVFLDEIESMPLHLQVKLLHVIQDRTLNRVGSNDPVEVNVRLIAATKVDLQEASEAGRFRKDLFYRLNVLPVSLPPLKERVEDIPSLFDHFLNLAVEKYEVTETPVVSSETLQELMFRSWQGNVRELRNEAERYVVRCYMNHRTGAVFKDDTPELRETGGTLSDQLEAFEKALIEKELKEHRGDIKKTYQALGIPRQTLYYKIQKYGLKRKDFCVSPQDA